MNCIVLFLSWYFYRKCDHELSAINNHRGENSGVTKAVFIVMKHLKISPKPVKISEFRVPQRGGGGPMLFSIE